MVGYSLIKKIIRSRCKAFPYPCPAFSSFNNLNGMLNKNKEFEIGEDRNL